MSISVKCDECGKTLKAPDSAAGKKAKCPQCGAVVKIPEQIYDAEAAEVDDSAEAEDAFDGVDSYDSPAASDDARKPCPMCGEMILANAAKCRFCKEVFDPKLKKKAKKKGSGGGNLDDDMSTGDWVVAILCPGIGCIAGIVWMIQGKSKGLKTFGISILFAILWNIISAAIQLAVKQ